MIALILTLLATSSAATLGTAGAEHFQASYDREAAEDYDGALAELRQVDPVGGQAYVVHLREGWLLYLLGRYPDAVAAYDTALKLHPSSLEARHGRLLPLMALRRWAEAEAECKQVLAVAPYDYTSGSRLAYVLYSTGRYEDAAAAYSSVLKHYGSDVDMRAGLGWSLLKAGQTVAARAQFAEVLSIAPNHASAALGLAEAGS